MSISVDPKLCASEWPFSGSLTASSSRRDACKSQMKFSKNFVSKCFRNVFQVRINAKRAPKTVFLESFLESFLIKKFLETFSSRVFYLLVVGQFCYLKMNSVDRSLFQLPVRGLSLTAYRFSEIFRKIFYSSFSSFSFLHASLYSSY